MKYELLRIAIEAVLTIGLLTAVHYLRKISRLVSLFRDYPPHKHVNGQVLYPPDFAPGQVQNLQR